jgi:glutamine amidotransferase
MIGIVDYGCGNLRNLENALEYLGLPVKLLVDPSEFSSVDRLILPGVGHFGHAMGSLHRTGLGTAIQALADRGGQVVGICLGMQLLLEGSSEAPAVRGLGLLPGTCRIFDNNGLKVPQIGWNRVEFEPSGHSGAAYFVHSYFLPGWVGDARAEWIGWSTYGRRFVAAFRAGNLVGCQFHPEKSGDWGLKFLKEVLSS